ncbi:hypothetical protein [Streptomyces sp. NPDC085529]|uniref:hypothetical protein n=1 Tax=Streptomyces sp. NPDC085529 TaxID=3365729 RepID=UPI0037D13281
MITKLEYERLRRHDLWHTGLAWFADADLQVRIHRRIAGHGSLNGRRPLGTPRPRCLPSPIVGAR